MASVRILLTRPTEWLMPDFGSGPEAYPLGALDIDDGPVVLPDSPLGHASAGAAAV